MKIKEIKVPAFNTVQSIGDDEIVTITGDLARDIEQAVSEDHWCDESFCDINAALGAGFPLVAAGLLIGATECAHVDGVLWAYRFMGMIDHANDPGDMYNLGEWNDWASWFDANARRCRGCDGFGFEVEVGWGCGNCGGKYGYRRGDHVEFTKSALDPEVSDPDTYIFAEVGSFDGLVEMPDPALPEDVYWLKVVDTSNGRVYEIRTDYIED